MKITIAITAKNEERTIVDTIQSLQQSIEVVESQINDFCYELVVVLNDTTDQTESRVPDGVAVIKTRGGLVEAQRVVSDREPFVIYSDADIIVDPKALEEVTLAMIDEPELRVAYPLKVPFSPARKCMLASALYTYNLRNGFETKRSHFNGKFFAIRHWSIPERSAFSHFPPDGFLSLRDGVLADDIYLSKSILAESGKGAIRETSGMIHYRAAETFGGMYRYYRRMRIELARIALLFPDLTWPQGDRRKTDFSQIKSAKFIEKIHWLVFQVAFQLCRLKYYIETKSYDWFRMRKQPFWQPVIETKQNIQNRIERMKLPQTYPLELWDLVVEGKTLWEWQSESCFAEKLSLGLKEVYEGEAVTASKGRVSNISIGYDSLFFTGGKSQDSRLREYFPNAIFAENAIFASCEAALEKWPEALVIDVGQTQIKIAYGETRLIRKRDFEQLPIGLNIEEGALLSYIKNSLPEIKPRMVVLALPCYIHDNLRLGGSSYAEMKGNPTLLSDLAKCYPDAHWKVLNDAEMAGLAAKPYLKGKSLVLTLGFGVGACIITES